MSTQNKVTTTLRLPEEHYQLISVAAEMDGVNRSDVLRSAVKQYIGGRSINDEPFAVEVRASARKMYDECVVEIRTALGESAISAEHEYPEWMREPEPPAA